MDLIAPELWVGFIIGFVLVLIHDWVKRRGTHPKQPTIWRLPDRQRPRGLARAMTKLRSVDDISVREVNMVPGKPQDFTGAHAGFEGEEEGFGDSPLRPFAAELSDYCRNLLLRHAPPSSGWTLRLPHILERIGPDQSPSDGL